MLNSLIGFFFFSTFGSHFEKGNQSSRPTFLSLHSTNATNSLQYNRGRTGLDGGGAATITKGDGRQRRGPGECSSATPPTPPPRHPPPACTLINLFPPIQTGALVDHCCDAACGLEGLLEGGARKPRTLVRLQTLPWQQGREREWDAGGRPTESWEKKEDAARRISADHLCKTNERGENADPANFSPPKKIKI